jgi:hypothetical protein
VFNRKFSFLSFDTADVLWLGCGSLLQAAEEAVGDMVRPTCQRATSGRSTHLGTDGQLRLFRRCRVDWDAVHDKYSTRIEGGLTNEQFSDLLRELQTELPAGALVYQSRGERIEAEIADTSSYEGIGAIIGFQEEDEPHIVILDVIDGSPAENAGLKPHDSIYKIDGNPILLEEGLTVVNRIRGPAGSTVTLQVKSWNRRAVEVTRQSVSSARSDPSDSRYELWIHHLPAAYQNMMPDISGFGNTTNRTGGLILDCAWPVQPRLALGSASCSMTEISENSSTA